METNNQLHSDKTILYVEDDHTNQIVIRGYLKNLGYTHILLAGDTEEALAILENPKITVDLILMDLGFPGIGGIALTKHIRKSTLQASKVPIIALTGNSESDAKAESLAAGMNDFLIKPVEKEKLQATLDRFI